MTTLPEAIAALWRRDLPETKALARLLQEVADDDAHDQVSAGTWAAAEALAELVVQPGRPTPMPRFLCPEEN